MRLLQWGAQEDPYTTYEGFQKSTGHATPCWSYVRPWVPVDVPSPSQVCTEWPCFRIFFSFDWVTRWLYASVNFKVTLLFNEC